MGLPVFEGVERHEPGGLRKLCQRGGEAPSTRVVVGIGAMDMPQVPIHIRPPAQMPIDLLAAALQGAGFDVRKEFPMLRRSLDVDGATVVSFGWISAATACRLAIMLNVATGNEVIRAPTPFERLPKGWPPYAWIADSVAGRIAGGEAALRGGPRKRLRCSAQHRQARAPVAR